MIEPQLTREGGLKYKRIRLLLFFVYQSSNLSNLYLSFLTSLLFSLVIGILNLKSNFVVLYIFPVELKVW
jgi:hypothetical protein